MKPNKTQGRSFSDALVCNKEPIRPINTGIGMLDLPLHTQEVADSNSAAPTTNPHKTHKKQAIRYWVGLPYSAKNNYFSRIANRFCAPAASLTGGAHA